MLTILLDNFLLLFLLLLLIVLLEYAFSHLFVKLELLVAGVLLLAPRAEHGAYRLDVLDAVVHRDGGQRQD